jgi:hypothetical protein
MPEGVRARVVSLREIASHPNLSLAPLDYLTHDERNDMDTTTTAEAEREALVAQVHQAGVSALEDLMSHGWEMIVIDDDGVGLIDGDAYRDLAAFAALLRTGEPKIDVEVFKRRVRAALERGLAVAQADENLHGIDEQHECYVAELVREFVGEAPDGA